MGGERKGERKKEGKGRRRQGEEGNIGRGIVEVRGKRGGGKKGRGYDEKRKGGETSIGGGEEEEGGEGGEGERGYRRRGEWEG